MSKVIIKGTGTREKVLTKVAYDDGYFYGFRVGTEATIEDLISLHNGSMCPAEAPADLYDCYEDIRGTAYSAGHEEGYADGYDKGLDALEKANLEDIDSNCTEAYRDGYNAGYKQAYNEGYEEGFKNGNAYPEDVINERAEAIARRRYDEIRTEAYEDGKNETIRNLFKALNLKPVSVDTKVTVEFIARVINNRLKTQYENGTFEGIKLMLDDIKRFVNGFDTGNRENNFIK